MPKNLDLKVSTASTLTFGFLKDSDGKTAGEDESLKFRENKVKQFAHIKNSDKPCRVSDRVTYLKKSMLGRLRSSVRKTTNLLLSSEVMK